MVLELLKRNAKINAQTFKGSTPLHEAIRKNQLEVVKILIHHGADINIFDENGHKPLAYAALIGNPDCLKVFLKSFEETMVPSGLTLVLLHLNFLSDPFCNCPQMFFRSSILLNVQVHLSMQQYILKTLIVSSFYWQPDLMPTLLITINFHPFIQLSREIMLSMVLSLL